MKTICIVAFVIGCITACFDSVPGWMVNKCTDYCHKKDTAVFYIYHIIGVATYDCMCSDGVYTSFKHSSGENDK